MEDVVDAVRVSSAAGVVGCRFALIHSYGCPHVSTDVYSVAVDARVWTYC